MLVENLCLYVYLRSKRQDEYSLEVPDNMWFRLKSIQSFKRQFKKNDLEVEEEKLDRCRVTIETVEMLKRESDGRSHMPVVASSVHCWTNADF